MSPFGFPGIFAPIWHNKCFFGFHPPVIADCLSWAARKSLEGSFGA
jgi:hypothetical protein